MKDKKIFKKWWFWLIVGVVVIGLFGSQGEEDNSTSDTARSQQASNDTVSESTLPVLKADDYKTKEGLVVYKDLKAKGYKIDAVFEKQALTDMNGKASDVFEPLDPNKSEDRQSVDAFVVGDLVQNGDNVNLTIAHAPKN